MPPKRRRGNSTAAPAGGAPKRRRGNTGTATAAPTVANSENASDNNNNSTPAPDAAQITPVARRTRASTRLRAQQDQGQAAAPAPPASPVRRVAAAIFDDPEQTLREARRRRRTQSQTQTQAPAAAPAPTPQPAADPQPSRSTSSNASPPQQLPEQSAGQTASGPGSNPATADLPSSSSSLPVKRPLGGRRRRLVQDAFPSTSSSTSTSTTAATQTTPSSGSSPPQVVPPVKQAMPIFKTNFTQGLPPRRGLDPLPPRPIEDDDLPDDTPPFDTPIRMGSKPAVMPSGRGPQLGPVAPVAPPPVKQSSGGKPSGRGMTPSGKPTGKPSGTYTPYRRSPSDPANAAANNRGSTTSSSSSGGNDTRGQQQGAQRTNPNTDVVNNTVVGTYVFRATVPYRNGNGILKTRLTITTCPDGLRTRLRYKTEYFLTTETLRNRWIGHLVGYRLSKPSRHRQHVDGAAWIDEFWRTNLEDLEPGVLTMAKVLRGLYNSDGQTWAVPDTANLSADHAAQLSNRDGNEIVYISSIYIHGPVSCFVPAC